MFRYIFIFSITSDVMKNCGIGKSTLYEIKQKKDEILKLMAETETGSGTSVKAFIKQN